MAVPRPRKAKGIDVAEQAGLSRSTLMAHPTRPIGGLSTARLGLPFFDSGGALAVCGNRNKRIGGRVCWDRSRRHFAQTADGRLSKLWLNGQNSWNRGKQAPAFR